MSDSIDFTLREEFSVMNTKITCGDWIDVLNQVPDESVQCVVTLNG